MDVTRLVEEVKSTCPSGGSNLVNEDVYMSTTFSSFVDRVVLLSRGGGQTVFEFDAVKMRVNNLDLEIPHQIFINNQFVDAVSGKTSKVKILPRSSVRMVVIVSGCKRVCQSVRPYTYLSVRLCP